MYKLALLCLCLCLIAPGCDRKPQNPASTETKTDQTAQTDQTTKLDTVKPQQFAARIEYCGG